MQKTFLAAIAIAALTLSGCSNISAYRPLVDQPSFEPGEAAPDAFGGAGGGGKGGSGSTSGGGGSTGPGSGPSTS